MSREPGPREKALREMREATAERKGKTTLAELKTAVEVAAKKRGRPPKAKK